jgi:type II secretory ATPase GspE/PulE/Tfp pilus assembly ATPase PilB-like protein
MASEPRVQSLLASVDLFHGLAESHLDAIAALTRRQVWEPGRMVIRQGEPSDSLHLVESGSFEVFYWDDLLRIERPFNSLRRGDVFGEMGVLSGEPRSASVRCRDAGATIILGKDDFLRFLDEHSRAAMALARTLAQRVIATNRSRAVPFERVANYSISPEVAQLLPLKLILQYRVLPLSLAGDVVRIGMVDPSDLVARNTASVFLNRYQTDWVCIALSDFEQFRDRQLHELTRSLVTREAEEEEHLIYPANAGPQSREEGSEAARILDECLRAAIDSAASDLHLEPSANHVGVRARIDGRLMPLRHPVTDTEHRAIVSRLKVLADMDIAEHRQPQDGAFRVMRGIHPIDMRVSTVPTPRGESVSIRFLDSSRRERNLRNLLVSERIADIVEALFLQPSGLVLVTGPTGSGKTTTLYAGIQMRIARDPTCKLVTAEDPVEYELDGATQVQVNERTGLAFPTILRSLLRQDPNVILIGEMRDRESMGIAIEAALTGHLVLSSLHTDRAIESVVRMRQQGIESYLIAAGLRGVISQRLVPKLCAACREETEPSSAVSGRLEASGILEPGEKATTYHAPGCAKCRKTGIKGRVGVYEVLMITPPLQAGIQNGLTEHELLQATPAGSYLPLQRYARHLLEHGLASADSLSTLFPSACALV